MKIGLIPQNFSEWWNLKLNRIPLPIYSEMIPLLGIRAVMAAQHLGVFEYLDTKKSSSQEIAQSLRLDTEGVERLLRLLCAMDYVNFEHNEFSLAKGFRKWLSDKQKYYVGHYIEYNYLRWGMIDQLEESIRTGKSLEIHQTLKTGADWKIYIEGLMDFAKISAEEIFKKVRFNQPKTLLDVAGGHGIYSTVLIKQYPMLKANLLDLPDSLEIGKKQINHLGLSDRFEFISGDLTKVDFPQNQDIILLFNILHHFKPQVCKEILSKCNKSLSKNGRIIIWEPFIEEDFEKPSYSGHLTGLMFYLTSQAKSYKRSEITNWLETTGLKQLKYFRLKSLPGVEIVEAGKM